MFIFFPLSLVHGFHYQGHKIATAAPAIMSSFQARRKRKREKQKGAVAESTHLYGAFLKAPPNYFPHTIDWKWLVYLQRKLGNVVFLVGLLPLNKIKVRLLKKGDIDIAWATSRLCLFLSMVVCVLDIFSPR